MNPTNDIDFGDFGLFPTASFISSFILQDIDVNCFAYGATRKAGLPSLSEEKEGDNCKTLFDEKAFLTNPEEWLLQADYAASRESEFKKKKSSELELVKRVLVKVLPEIDEIRIRQIPRSGFRSIVPIADYRQSAKDKLKKPGYFWLAYDWDNLFFACEVCNRRNKKTLFPLREDKNRCISYAGDLNQEEPLFINPEIENPEDFISFRGEIVFAIDGNLRGKITIEGAGLDRVELEGNRKTTLEKIKRLYEIANATPELPQSKEAIEYLYNECASETHEYSSMIKAALAAEFRF